MFRNGARLIAALMLGGALMVAAGSTAGATSAAATDVYFSEYVEGSSNNKALEIYNGTGAPVDLAAYSVKMFFNGSASAGLTIALSGTVTAGDVFVLAQSSASAAILAEADQTNGSGWFNGDDAVELVKGSAVVDSIGQVGVDPGSEWGTGLTSTADNTLRRKASVTGGDTVATDAFDPAVEWDGFATDTFDDLGKYGAGPGPTTTPPSGVGTATPASVDAGSSTLLTVAVTAGTNPPSTGITVAGNLTSIGGSATQTFFDNGSNGDAAPNDGTYSYLATVPLSVTPGAKSLPVTIADAESRSGATTIALTVAASCGSTYTSIAAIQGSGTSAAVTGQVSTEGVVVADNEGPQPALRGFYLEDPQGDGDPTTSDGIFVFNNGRDEVALGDRVRVSGTAGENQGQTQISVLPGAVKACGSGTVAPVDVSLPVPAGVGGLDYLERFEGMLVRFPQTLTVTEHFQLGRFGQVVMSSGGRQQVPTSVVEPGAAAIAMEAQNRLNRIIVDDALQTQNPDPIVFGRGGNPLSAVNTLRGGDTATGMVGVMTYTWAGNSASGNAYRLRPVNALGGGVPAFQPTNPRPAGPPAVGGDVKVGAMNLLNFFNTFDGASSSPPWACNGGVGGTLMDCRGADDQGEFDRQWPKTVAAITGLDPDVLGIMEIENDGYGPDSAIQFLVDKLNAATSAGKYAFIDADAGTGQTNALGTDAIKVGILYQPARVTPVGTTAVLNTDAFVNGGDSAPRNRPSLAQAFQWANGERFVIDANHLKSKGSACDVPDTGDGQANCAAVRTTAATLLAEWLATDPTGAGDTDVLLVGDLNSYAKEDPIAALEAHGFENLIAAELGSEAYSYVFDGEWGYLDHALGTASLTSQVSGVGEWHINADEPSVLDYNDDFKSAGQLSSLYAPDQFRISDHDPVVVGLDLKTTVEGLCRATTEAVTKNAGLANSLCVKLRNGAFGAYRNELSAQSGKALTEAAAAALARFSTELG